MTVKEYMTQQLRKRGHKDFEFIFEPCTPSIKPYLGCGFLKAITHNGD